MRHSYLFLLLLFGFTTACTAENHGQDKGHDHSALTEPAQESAVASALQEAAPTAEEATTMADEASTTVEEAAPTVDTPKADTTPGGKIVFSEQTFNFGKVMKGEELKHTFTMTNTSEEVVEITNVKPACGCTVSGEYTALLEPGASGIIPLGLKTDNLRNKFNKRITVTTTHPTQNYLSLELTGEVVEFITVIPGQAFFGNLKPEASAERTIEVKNQTEEPVEISLNTKGLPEGITVEVEEKTPGMAWTLIVSATAPADGERPYLSGTFTIESDHEKAPKITVAASARILPPIEVRPAQIMLARPFSREITRRLTVHNHQDDPVEITEAVAEDEENIKVEVEPLNEGKSYSLKVTMSANWMPEKPQNISLTFSDGKELKVPVIPRIPPRQQTAPQVKKVEETQGD